MEQAKSIAISVIQKPQHADAAAGNLPSSWGSATPERHLTIGITCAEDNYRLANPARGEVVASPVLSLSYELAILAPVLQTRSALVVQGNNQAATTPML